jgi:hypothetical protein
VTDELRTHWVLHGLDEEAVRLDADRARLAPERRALDQRLTAAERAVARAHAGLDARRASRRQQDRDLATLDAEVKAADTRLAAVTDPRAFDAGRQHLQHARDRRDALEAEALAALEAEEHEAAALPGIEAERDRIRDEVAAARARLDAEEARLGDALAALDSARATAAAALPDAARERYARLRAGHGGRAVAELQGAACRACGTVQPPHAAQEARRRASLPTCEGCGRLLLMAPPEAP